MKKALITLLLIASTGAYGQTSTQRNIFGGEDYYSNGRYMGYSAPNIHGGRDFYRAPGMRQYGYSGMNPELQSGYAIGAGLRSIIDAFRGNSVER